MAWARTGARDRNEPTVLEVAQRGSMSPATTSWITPQGAGRPPRAGSADAGPAGARAWPPPASGRGRCHPRAAKPRERLRTGQNPRQLKAAPGQPLGLFGVASRPRAHGSIRLRAQSLPRVNPGRLNRDQLASTGSAELCCDVVAQARDGSPSLGRVWCRNGEFMDGVVGDVRGRLDANCCGWPPLRRSPPRGQVVAPMRRSISSADRDAASKGLRCRGAALLRPISAQSSDFASCL